MRSVRTAVLNSILGLIYFLLDRRILDLGLQLIKRIAAVPPLSSFIESTTNPPIGLLVDDYIENNLTVRPRRFFVLTLIKQPRHSRSIMALEQLQWLLNIWGAL